MRRLARWLVMAAAALSVAVGCKPHGETGDTKPASAAPKSSALPELTVKADTPNLLLTWIDEKGDFHVEEKAAQGLTAQRIYQDLKLELQFLGSYESVKRFVRRLRRAEPARVWRIEVAPGEEAQVDFGLGAPIIASEGRKR